MIVRISGEGQFSIDDAATAELNRLDSELEAAVNRDDEAAFTRRCTACSTRSALRAHRCPPTPWKSPT